MSQSFGISSVQGRLGLIFLAFLLLLVVSVSVTFVGLETQKQDARIINLAGRQRMLAQQMANQARSFERGGRSSPVLLLDSTTAFEQTLTALRGGGQIQDYTGESFAITPPDNPGVSSELETLQRIWQSYRLKIDLLIHFSGLYTGEPIVNEIEDLSSAVIDQADRVVRAFEVIATEKVIRLRTYQFIFLFGGLVLLSLGWWIVRGSIVRPLSQLEKSAQKIGEGDLSSPIRLDGPSEVQVLGKTMETMQAQILASRQDLQHWAETLENRVQQRTRALAALSAVSQEINSHLSIQEVLSSVAEKAQSLMGSEVVALCLLDTQEKVLSLHAAIGPETAIQKNQSPADSPTVDQVLHQHCAHPCGMQSREGFCTIIAPAYRSSHVAAPLYSRERVIGALCVGSSKPEAFRPELTPVLTQLSDVASVALENSRLYQQAEYAATLEERQRIAAEMHDGLLQTLSFLRLMVLMTKDHLVLGDLEKAEATMRQIERAEEQASREIRQAIASLQDDFPLTDTLQERLSGMVVELSGASPPVKLETTVVLPLVLSRQESEQVLRVVREAALNAQRYSQAEIVYVCLEKSGNEIIVSVRDQGIGFTPGIEPDDGRSRFGLKIMRARAARLGGKLVIQSSPDAGTLVELRWMVGASQHLEGRLK